MPLLPYAAETAGPDGPRPEPYSTSISPGATAPVWLLAADTTAAMELAKPAAWRERMELLAASAT